ncbi:MAG TPA: hypothetical protein VF516_06360 [Kofleriaceae bacterium]
MLRGSRRIAVLLASALLAGPARPALADPRPASAKDQKLASELVKKAIALAEAGDHAGAIQLYNDAYKLVPNVLLLPSIGAQYQELGQWDDALEYFCRYLKEDPAGVNVAFARSSAKHAQQELGRKNIDSRNPCAAGSRDDGDGGGKRKIDDGDGGGRRKIDDGDGGGKRKIDDGDGKRKIDDGDGGGKRKIDDSDGGGKRKIDNGNGNGMTVDPPPAPARSNGNPVLMYTGLAAGIAGIAAGGISVYYGFQGKSISDEINSHQPGTPWPDDIQTKMKEGEHDNRLQVGYMVASGVLVATGIVLYVVGRPDANERTGEKTAVHVAPTANGVTVFGRF